MSDVTLWQGDCLEEMKRIEDGSIDAIICDPPYGTTACKWDSVIPFEPMWEQLKRIIKPKGAIVLFGSQPFTSALVMSNVKWFKYEWVWKKSKGSNFVHAPNMPLKTVENISVFSNGLIAHQTQTDNRMVYFPQGITPGRTRVKQNPNKSELKYHRDSQRQHKGGYVCKNENYPDVLLSFKNDGKVHPTQKPVKLLEYLIKTYTHEGETVLDFTMGSGTTGVGCVNLNRNFIGIEKEPEYFTIAQRRIDEAINTPKQLELV